MGNALDALHAGDLKATREQLEKSVRSTPADSKQRTFLFQLYAILGEYDRALTQLNVCSDLDPATLPMVQAYSEALRCETFRLAVFRGEKSPVIMGDPGEWLPLLIEATRRLAGDEAPAADRLRAEAFEKAETSAGRLQIAGEGDATTEQSFEWIADADSRLGPVCEVIVNGRYYWVPFSRIVRIDLDPPEDLRDMVWAPAHFEWTNRGEAFGFIPTRYPGSEVCEDSALRLSRKTEWREHAPDFYTGLGQRTFTTDSGDTPIQSIRQILLDNPIVEEEPESKDE